MYKKLLIITTLVAILPSSTQHAFAAEEPIGSRDFGVLYIGDGSDADARQFRTRFLNMGWNQEVWKTSHSTVNFPRHFHFTRGVDNNHTEAGADADILYISGHGWECTTLPIYRLRGGTQPMRMPREYWVTPDTTTISNAQWEVGIEWRGLFPNNESRWNHDLEWVVLAACSQLNTVLDGSLGRVWPEGSPTNSAAKTWARTLLGNGARAHGIFGYRGSAPGDGADVRIADTFINYMTIAHPLTVLTSWQRANTPALAGNSTWAAVVHHANEADRLHGSGHVTPDTTGTYHIDYWSSFTSYNNRRILDGRGGRYETMSERPSLIERAFTKARGLFEFSAPAYARQGAAGFKVGETEFRIGENAAKQLEASNIEKSKLKINRNRENEKKTVNSLLRNMRNVERSKKEDGTVVYEDGRSDAKIKVYPSGTIAWDRHEQLENKPTDLTKDQAVQRAQDFIEEYGGFPADAEVTRVTTVEVTELDLSGDGAEERPRAVEYSILFSRKVNGISTDGAYGIEVVIDSSGPTRMHKAWPDIKTQNSDLGDRVIDPAIALESFKDIVDDYWTIENLGTAEITDINLVYHREDYKTNKTEIVPAWRILIDDTLPVYVDAITGGKLER